MAQGVSVAICTHNGRKLLPTTISHLKQQQVSDQVAWEVLVIDNCSSDGTAEIARACWGDDGPAPLNVVQEPRLGLSYARERAFTEARHEIVSFVDDDNWVSPRWVKTVSECMSAEPELAALGSTNTAVAETAFPNWFPRWAHYYAAHASCEFPSMEGWLLVGAGMSVRKHCWDEMKTNGFRQRLTDRVGTRLTTCGDLELGCALQLAGWKIRVEPSLQLRHFMTPARLQWRYLRHLARKTGEAMTLLDSYFYFSRPQTGFKGRLRQYWWAHFARETMQLIARYSMTTVLGYPFCNLEGRDDIVFLEQSVGRLLGLLRLRSQYGRLHREIARAPWRRTELVH